MSNQKMGTSVPNKMLDSQRRKESNKKFTRILVAEFRKHFKIRAVSTIAKACDISTNTVNSWFCKGKGINGIHLARLEREFPFVKEYLDRMWQEGKLK